MDSPPSRKPCFIEEDDGLASIAEMEAGFSGSHSHNHHAFFSRSLCLSSSINGRSSFRNRNLSVSSPRSVRLYDARFEEHRPHFLDSCSLCKKSLAGNTDIYMYRGDSPFCSEECREEQIEIDEANEKKMKLSSMKAKREKDQRKSSSSSSSSSSAQPYNNFIISTVAAA